ncbi:hypothetical protein [Enterococcus sp. AZ180]|uniref:hypothetical protein n=1 Tax=Enterococcus sp. AZ180 TaxID=2774961 RepID=UPI003F2326C9
MEEQYFAVIDLSVEQTAKIASCFHCANRKLVTVSSIDELYEIAASNAFEAKEDKILTFLKMNDENIGNSFMYQIFGKSIYIVDADVLDWNDNKVSSFLHETDAGAQFNYLGKMILQGGLS